MNVHSKKRRRGSSVEDGVARGRGRPLVDDKRRRILDAGLRTFAERGYHGTAVPEVATAAKVSTGTLYHYFASKEVLVNEVYRDAKQRLKAALLDGLPALDVYRLDHGQAWFTAVWSRLAAFADAEPDAFRFLEMQDHVPYLDAESRALEVSVLAPLWLAGTRLVGGGERSVPELRDPRGAGRHAIDHADARGRHAIDHADARGHHAIDDADARGHHAIDDADAADERGRHAIDDADARGHHAIDHADARGLPIDIAIALLWGAFVGVVKASRLGYIQLDAHRLEQAGAACWRMIAPASSRATEVGRLDSPRGAVAAATSVTSTGSRTASPASRSASTTAPPSRAGSTPRTPSPTTTRSAASPTTARSTASPTATRSRSRTTSPRSPRTTKG